MAENKVYFSKSFEKGTLLINEDVLETIVINAVKDVEGVVGLSTRPAMDIIDIVGKKYIGKSLKITISDDDQLQVFCNINVLYGKNVVEVAKAVQNAISNALESSANATVTAVNVNVCGIVRQ